MITLQRITDPARLDEYHRFRHRIYCNSDKAGYLDRDSGYDRDAYDVNSIHLGWYVDGVLRGCVRFIRPIDAPLPLYCLTHMPVQPASCVLQLLDGYEQQGLPFVEVSRICIDPAYRDLATVKDFVLATMAMSHVLGLDQAVFTCDRPHAAFWLRMGFTKLAGAERFFCTARKQIENCTLVYRHADLPLAIREKLPAREALIHHEQHAA